MTVDLCLEGKFLQSVEFPFYSWSLLFGKAEAGYLQHNKHKFKDNI